MSGITRVRPQRYQRHITIDIALVESDLSNEAFRLWVYLFSRPDNWQLNRSVMAQKLGSEYKLEKATKELKKVGLLVTKARHENGRYAGHDWLINGSITEPSPAKSQHPEIQDLEYQDAEIQDLEIQRLDIQDPVIQDPDIQDALKEQPGVKEQPRNTKSSSPSQVSSKALPPSPAREGPAGEGDDQARRAKYEQLLRDMSAVGVPVAKARALAKAHGMLACQQQLDWLPYREGVEKPGKYLAWAIAEGKAAPPGLPAPVKAKAEAQQTAARVTSKPVRELSGDELQRLGELLWPGFRRVAEQGLAELTVTPETARPGGVPVGTYALGNDGQFQWITPPGGEDLILTAYHLPQFDWPGKTLEDNP